MAFICTARGEHFSADVFQDENACSIVVDIGYDDEKDCDYKVVVGLEPQAGGGAEFYFHIIEIDGETGRDYPYWSGRDVARFIGPADRHEIMCVILTLVQVLLQTARPERVECVTHDANPPDAALLKHRAILEVFSECGYNVITADPYHGKRVWWMERTENCDVALQETGS